MTDMVGAGSRRAQGHRPRGRAGSQFVPRYYEIEQALRARIARLRPDDPLPSDAGLCREFGVSRMTARNAVARLTQEGLVYRVPGRGTFVAEPPVHRQAGNLLSFTEEMRRRGRVPTSRVLDRRVRPGSADETGRLRLPDDSDVLALRRVRLADDEPMAIEDAVFPPGLAAGLLEADLETGSLHAALVRLERVPAVGRATLSAEPATREDARTLGVKTGSPLLVERRLIIDTEGRPLELTASRYPGDRYGLDVAFDVELPRHAT